MHGETVKKIPKDSQLHFIIQSRLFSERFRSKKQATSKAYFLVWVLWQLLTWTGSNAVAAAKFPQILLLY